MRYRCTIHNVTFGAEGLPKDHPDECPMCVAEEMAKLKEELATAISHRDALLSVIEIKRTVIPAIQP